LAMAICAMKPVIRVITVCEAIHAALEAARAARDSSGFNSAMDNRQANNLEGKAMGSHQFERTCRRKADDATD
jgi:hypothetical protein